MEQSVAMPAGTEAVITEGTIRASARTALERGEIAVAADILRAHLADCADPEARLDLARIVLLLHEYDEARALIEAAFREFTDAGSVKRAAIAASRMSEFYFTWAGNQIAGRAWRARAWRLLDDEGPCLERGWIATNDVGCHFDDPAELRERAGIALETARRFGDTDLEVKALADGGLGLVLTGEVEAGMRQLDEAMSLITAGVVADGLVAGQSVCAFFSACSSAGDLGRLESWCELLRERAMIGERGIPILMIHCDSVYGTMMCNLGRWGEAESVLGALVARTESRAPAFGRLRAVCALAELRILQGRLAEAEQLLLGLDDHLEALIPMARLHLARGDYDLAAGSAGRGLRLLGEDRLRAAQLLAVLVEAELGRDCVDAAAAAAGRLDECARTAGVPALEAEAAFALARVRASRGETDDAIAGLDHALTRLTGAELPLLRSKLRLELARLHTSRDHGAAVTEARAVAAIHHRLEIPLGDESAQVLRELGVSIPASAPQAAADARSAAASGTAALEQTGEGWWSVSHGGASFRLRDTKGLRYLQALLANPGLERHVLDLVELADPSDAVGDATRRRLGDAGPMLDAQAKAAYRRRIESLREDVAEAEAFGDDDRVEALQEEIDAIVHELTRALGLGGRDRRAASAAERARLNVTRAIRAAIARIEQVDGAAGAALETDVRTGCFCSYEPTPASAVRWTAAP